MKKSSGGGSKRSLKEPRKYPSSNVAALGTEAYLECYANLNRFWGLRKATYILGDKKITV